MSYKNHREIINLKNSDMQTTESFRKSYHDLMSDSLDIYRAQSCEK